MPTNATWYIKDAEDLSGRDVRSVRFWIAPEEDGGFYAICQRIPGIATQGDTIEECKASAREALDAVLEVYRDDGVTVPWEQPEEKPHPLAIEISFNVEFVKQ